MSFDIVIKKICFNFSVFEGSIYAWTDDNKYKIYPSVSSDSHVVKKDQFILGTFSLLEDAIEYCLRDSEK